MRFYCDSCHAQYVIDDERIEGRVVTVKCNNCGNSSEVRIPATPTPLHPNSPSKVSVPLAPFDNRPKSGRHQHLRATPTPSKLSDDQEEWYYAIDGEASGPYPFHEVKKRFEAGVLGNNAYVWHESFSESGWKPVREVAIFSAILYSDETRVGGVIKRPVRTSLADLSAANAPTAARFDKSSPGSANLRAEKIDEMRRKLESAQAVEVGRKFLKPDPIKPDDTTRPETSALEDTTKAEELPPATAKAEVIPKGQGQANLRATKLAAQAPKKEVNGAKLSLQQPSMLRPAVDVGAGAEPFPRAASLPDFSLNPAEFSHTEAQIDSSSPIAVDFVAPPTASPAQENSDQEFEHPASDVLSNASTIARTNQVKVAGGPLHNAANVGFNRSLSGFSIPGAVGGVTSLDPSTTVFPDDDSPPNKVQPTPLVSPAAAQPNLSTPRSTLDGPSSSQLGFAPNQPPGARHFAPGTNTPEQHRRRESLLDIQARTENSKPKIAFDESEVEPVTPSYQAPPRKGNGLLIGILLLCVIAGVAGYFFFVKSIPVDADPSSNVVSTNDASPENDDSAPAPDATGESSEDSEAAAGDTPSDEVQPDAANLERPRPEVPEGEDGSPPGSDPVEDTDGKAWKPTPPPGGVGQVKLPNVQPPKTLTREQALEGIKKVSNSVNICRERYIRRGGEFETSEISVDITIEGTGDVTQLAVKPASLNGTEFVRCMQSQRPKWKFVAFGGPPQKVIRKFIIQ